MPSSIGPEQRLYRILSLDRFIRMLKADEWYFAHPSEWPDPTEWHIKNEWTEAVFAQCWCTRGVSDAMWRIYSQDEQAIRIRTTRGALQAAFRNHPERGTGLRFRLRKIEYLSTVEYKARITEIARRLKEKPNLYAKTDHLLLKRRAFDHEKESRLMVYHPSGKRVAPDKGVLLKMDTRKLIDGVLVDPRATPDVVASHRKRLRNAGFTGKFGKSKLYELDLRLEA